MKKMIGSCFLLAGTLIGLWSYAPLPWLWQSRWQRIQKQYHNDIDLFFESSVGEKLKRQLGLHEFLFSDPQVARELEEVSFPKTYTDSSGPIIVRVEVIRWIFKNRYGYIFQHNFFDTTDGDEEKIYEWSKTYEAGLYL